MNSYHGHLYLLILCPTHCSILTNQKTPLHEIIQNTAKLYFLHSKMTELFLLCKKSPLKNILSGITRGFFGVGKHTAWLRLTGCIVCVVVGGWVIWGWYSVVTYASTNEMSLDHIYSKISFLLFYSYWHGFTIHNES